MPYAGGLTGTGVQQARHTPDNLFISLVMKVDNSSAISALSAIIPNLFTVNPSDLNHGFVM
jgi:hypothetical protein